MDKQPRSVCFRASGVPRPQGSKSYFNGRMVEASKHLKPWREVVATAGRCARSAQIGDDSFKSAVIKIVFVFERPASHYRTGRFAEDLRADAPAEHTQKPDLDKLQRGIFDAVTDARIWVDDCVASSCTATKVWVDRFAGVGPGVRVVVTEVTSD